jgi:hypothetical protein
VRAAADAFVVAATGVPLAEPIESMAMRPVSPPTTERPVSMTPLIDTLPKAGSEHRKVTVAAAAVIATALGLSALLVAGSRAASQPPEAQGTVQAAPPAPAPAPSPTVTTDPAPTALAEIPMEPEPTAPAAEAPKPPKPNPPMVKGPKATYVAPAKPVRPVAAVAGKTSNPDEDLERLSNITPPGQVQPQPSPPPEKLPPPQIPPE